MDIPLNNKNFQKIIKFYLFECPVRTVARIDKKQPNGGKRHREYKKVSKMGKTFKERGLDGPNLNTLRAAMKKVTKDLALVAIKDFIAESDIPCNNEYVVIRKNDESVGADRHHKNNQQQCDVAGCKNLMIFHCPLDG